jgi:RNA polymerase sigma-70 factor (ECF subfamily)
VETPTEHELLRRVAAKDRVAFEELYHRYYPRLFGYVFRLTRRADLVEEVLNDAMLAIWTHAARFAGRSRPSTWIFGIAHHKALKALGRLRPHQQATGEEPRDSDALEPLGPDSLLDRRELRGLLGQALRRLSTEQRAVVELTYFHDFSYQEIAQILDCPVNTVKTRMFHARRRLRDLLPLFGVSHAG